MSHKEVFVELPQGRISALVGGSGPPVVVLSREYGRRWGRLHDRLAAGRTVVAPAYPGWDTSERPAWLRNVTDMAALVGLALERLEATPAAIVGLGFGAWVAAEIAAHSPSRVARLVLHAPMGIKPPRGEILDQFFFSSSEYMDRCFTSRQAREQAFPIDEQVVDLLEQNREMTTRVAWKPYMYDAALPHLLKACKAPTLLVTSPSDAIVPASCASAYAEVLPNVRKVELPTGGHAAELEVPDALADAIGPHLA